MNETGGNECNQMRWEEVETRVVCNDYRSPVQDGDL